MNDVFRSLEGWSAGSPAYPRYGYVDKFGRNADIDTATDPEDVWSAGGLYAFPTAANATTIVSTSVADDGDPAGTGALTVAVQGLDANWLLVNQTATMNGTAAVTLTTPLIRVFRAFVATAGSGGTNAGVVTVLHGATVLAQIDASAGQTLMAIYTIPADYHYGAMSSWWSAFEYGVSAADTTVAIYQRPFGGAWRIVETAGLSETGSTFLQRIFTVPKIFQPKTDILVRVARVSANEVGISAGFDIVLVPQ